MDRPGDTVTMAGPRMRLCPLALTGYVAFCFLAIAVCSMSYRAAEELINAATDAALSSTELYHYALHHSIEPGAHANVAEEAEAMKQFQLAHLRLARVFDGDARPTAPVYLAPLSHLAALMDMPRPPAATRAIWQEGGAEGSIDGLMHAQLSVCRAICAVHDMSPAQRAAALEHLNDISIETLLPRLRALKAEATRWRDRTLSYSHGVLLLGFFGLVGAILFTRFRIVAPLVRDLDVANRALACRNAELEQKVADRTRALSDALDEAHAAGEARTRFLASVNHEMRTPMNGVLGVTALLERSGLDERQRKLVDLINQSGRTLVRLIDDVLDYVSLSSGRMSLDRRPVELGALLDDTLGLLAPLAAEKGLGLRLELSAGGGAPVLADAVRVAQIVNNVVGNAIKFTAEGHVTVRAGRMPDGDHDRLVLEVIDTGPGIREDKMRDLFVPFDRRALGKPTQGTGLGLAITKSLVDQMQGTLSVESDPGQGTRVEIRLAFQRAGAGEGNDGLGAVA